MDSVEGARTAVEQTYPSNCLARVSHVRYGLGRVTCRESAPRAKGRAGDLRIKVFLAARGGTGGRLGPM